MSNSAKRNLVGSIGLVIFARILGRLFRAKIAISTSQPRCPCQTASPPLVSMESESPLTSVRWYGTNFRKKTAPIHYYYREVSDSPCIHHVLYSKESKQCKDELRSSDTTPCSYKVHLVVVCSNGSILTSIGIPTLLP